MYTTINYLHPGVSFLNFFTCSGVWRSTLPLDNSNDDGFHIILHCGQYSAALLHNRLFSGRFDRASTTTAAQFIHSMMSARTTVHSTDSRASTAGALIRSLAVERRRRLGRQAAIAAHTHGMLRMVRVRRSGRHEHGVEQHAKAKRSYPYGQLQGSQRRIASHDDCRQQNPNTETSHESSYADKTRPEFTSYQVAMKWYRWDGTNRMTQFGFHGSFERRSGIDCRKDAVPQPQVSLAFAMSTNG
jgi:hypothetical protein